MLLSATKIHEVWEWDWEFSWYENSIVHPTVDIYVDASGLSALLQQIPNTEQS